MRNWVFTVQPSHFRIEGILKPGEELDWPTFSHFKFATGDLVFLYASTPVRQMIAQLEIENPGIPFAAANPRNELRKWPKTYSSVPWMRLRVLKTAPVPCRPLERGSLYYHTEFKPSPYPKLLHEKEIDYVMRAFENASRTPTTIEGERLQPSALAQVEGGAVLSANAEKLKGGKITDMHHSLNPECLTLTLRNIEGVAITLHAEELRRVIWNYEYDNRSIAHIQLNESDNFLLLHIAGADLEVMAAKISVKQENSQP